MLYAINGCKPPAYWKHDPQLTNYNYNTVALILSANSIIPSDEWKHSPEL